MEKISFVSLRDCIDQLTVLKELEVQVISVERFRVHGKQQCIILGLERANVERRVGL